MSEKKKKKKALDVGGNIKIYFYVTEKVYSRVKLIRSQYNKYDY